MKSNKIIIGGFGIIILLLILFIVSKQSKEKTKIEETNKIPTPPPPLPPIKTNINNIASNNNRPLDPTSGEGLRTIEAYAKTLFKDQDLMSSLKRENNIGVSYYQGITPAKLGIFLKSKLHSQLGITNDYEVPIIPKFMDGGKFLQDVSTFKNYVKNPRPKIDILGIEGAATEMFRLGNFSDTAGFILVPSESKNDDDLNESGFSKCDQIRSKKRKECRKDHWEDFGKQLYKVADKMKSDTEKFNDVLFDFTAQKLVDAGWDFIGYIPTVNI